MVTEWSSCFIYSLSLEKNRSGARRDQVKRGKIIIRKKWKRLATNSYFRRDETSGEYHLVAKNYHPKKQHYQ